MSVFNSLLCKLSRKGTASSTEVVAERFIQLFLRHGVDISQIPRLFPCIKLADLQDLSTLLAVLNFELLDQASRLFGVRVEWLEGVGDEIYEYLACCKQPAVLLEHLDSLLKKKADGDRKTFDLRVLCTTKELDLNNEARQWLVPVLVEKIALLGEETIYRYHVYRDGYDWGYYRTRIELKAIARIVFHGLRSPVSLFEISEADMQKALEGRLIPYQALRQCLISSPSLEDYALASSESGVAKETEELPEVLRYIEEQGLSSFSFRSLRHVSEVATEETERTEHAEDWRETARSIADEFHSKDVNAGAHDSLKGMSDRVANEMRKRNLFGPRGPLSAATILREALQGGKWERKIAKEKQEIRE